jgi:hypothetical protein
MIITNTFLGIILPLKLYILYIVHDQKVPTKIVSIAYHIDSC